MPTDIQVLMVYPRFQAGSFWNYRSTCELVGAKYPAPPLGLITVAAMLPDTWNVRLIDRNTETLADSDIRSADIVFTGGMLPQQSDVQTIIAECRSAGVPVVVGGPDVTSSPEQYGDADFRVLGEAEEVLPRFIAAFERGERAGTFEAEKFKTDVTQTPVPRFDLLNFDNYVQVNVQYSRGCPFTCEFCDIIELYGRKPRTKTNAQILRELQALYDLGYRGHVDFVDDNLIGNKKAVKAFLPELIAWQKAHRRPFELSTEASLNLADDPALLTMMQQAGFFAVFIGIESPDPDVLTATRKKQNTRRDIAASVRKVYEAGIFVVGGFIVGFDEESDQVADEIAGLIEEAAVPVAMAGLLYALPTTQLTRRLAAQGRLHAEFDVADPEHQVGDQCTAGLNFETLRPRAEILADYRKVIERVYAPEAYFSRLRKLVSLLDMSGPNGDMLNARLGSDIRKLGRLIWSITRKHPAHRGALWRMIGHTLLRNPRALNPMLQMVALYVHLGPFARFVLEQIDRQIAEIESGAWQPPALVAAE
ncbi:B12-binding domain-containing radical SAM protein [Stappia taiwanensis]|uniref:B12-binding domain-containing radical SAM protein n=1 Tax=Stappia taiwanensis TaxID=992267 RepID=A0A838Y0Q9_9HYPH|nr:B12-binding domain-containing radical SAM protein [Stappia taiwanensis]MBA4612824.1 B12-binding domain-containing radical SAM protein [Stappia taiwanensis]GGE89725.1 B12-binding domain-containing radical SAM protein [Stappia taiwanensis]